MERKYRDFVDRAVSVHNARWAAVILEDGAIPAYRAYDEEMTDRFLRFTRSFYWTLMNTGDMADVPDLSGKYLEIIWNERYLYMFRVGEITIMLGTDKKIEEFMIDLISSMDPKMAPHVPGMIGFGIGDYSGNTLSSYINMESIREISRREHKEEFVKGTLEEATKAIFEKFMYMGESGFGNGRYMEVRWKNVTGWMFPYKDKVAVAIFNTDKIDTIINVISYVMMH